jgi:hypothetical protein
MLDDAVTGDFSNEQEIQAGPTAIQSTGFASGF